MTEVIVKDVSVPAAPKITAAHIEANCPVRLQVIAKEIEARFKKAEKQYEQAENNIIAIQALMDEARALCDDGGFKKFRELLCPQLSKSRAYELFAIASDKKSIQETRASTRARVAKYRANKAPASHSATVTEKSGQDALGAPTGDDEHTAIVHALEQQPAKPRTRIATGHRVLLDFSSIVKELIRMTRNKEVERFVKTSVGADDLARLGKFLIDIVNLKKSEVTQRTELPDNGTLTAPFGTTVGIGDQPVVASASLGAGTLGEGGAP